MSRESVLMEMEVNISLLSSEVKDNPFPLKESEYRHIVAIRDYCIQIIEEEIGK